MPATEPTHIAAPRRTGAEIALGLLVRGALAAPLAFGCGALAIGAAYTPDEVGRGVFYRAVGLAAPQCPGCVMCGMSRAFSALLHGDFRAALAFNKLVVVAFPAVLVLAAAALYAIVKLTRQPLRLPHVHVAPPAEPGLSVRVSQGEP